MARIGIFGGTFDPFTPGHAAVSTKAFEQLNLDKLIIVPTTVNYYRSDKRYLFTYDEKLKIIRDFMTGFKYPTEIDTIEQDKDGSWRTIDLVQYFRQKFPKDKLILIIGEDSYNEFRTWTRWREILEYVELAVANRCKSANEWKPQEEVPALPINMGDRFEDCSATVVRNKLIEEVMDLYLSDKDWYANLGGL